MKKIKNKYFLLLLITGFLTIMFSSCYYDNEEQLYPNIQTTCDTSNVTYSATITPILNTYCLNCHGASAATTGGSYFLNTYDLVKSHIDRINIDINQGTGSDPMPKGGGKIPDCNILQIKVWTTKGALNN